VHDVGSGEPRGPFVVVDCSTIVPSLSGSELFGHERGAFTGADRARSGAFAAANGGTLFLDEIGELPLPLQAELLRVLQEHTYKAVGGNAWVRTEFRLVSATNRDLETEQRAGRFRSDLYHRIASGVVRMPPLRERTEDLEMLFRHFLCQAMHRDTVEVTAPVLAMLRNRPFPGNLRELRQLATTVAARHSGSGPVTPGDVPPRERPTTSVRGTAEAHRLLEQGVRECLYSGVSLLELKSLVGDLAVEMALSRYGGSSREAAAALGVTERAVQLRRRSAQPAL
jgi:transcriptional regulator with GAF, ATPase, and Fis domain